MNQAPLKSFLPIAPNSHFPLENLPLGVFRSASNAAPHVGTRVGDTVVDLAVLGDQRLLDLSAFGERPVFDCAALNPFMALGRVAWRELRRQLQHLLSEGNAALRDAIALRRHLDADDVAEASRQHVVRQVGDEEDADERRERKECICGHHQPPAHANKQLAESEHGQRRDDVDVISVAQRLAGLAEVDAPDQESEEGETDRGADDDAAVDETRHG